MAARASGGNGAGLNRKDTTEKQLFSGVEDVPIYRC